MYSENISKHRHECQQGKQTAPSKLIFLVTSVISKWRKWDWEIMEMVKSDRNGVFVRNTFSYITIEHLDIVQMSPFQITLEGCQMKMFRPSWWLEISALGRYIEIYFIILVFRFELWPFYKKEIEVEMKNWKLSLDFWENVLN